MMVCARSASKNFDEGELRARRPALGLARLEGGEHLVLLLGRELHERFRETLLRDGVHAGETGAVGRRHRRLLVGERLVDEVDAARFDGAWLVIGGDDPAGDRLDGLPLGFAEDRTARRFLGGLEGAWPGSVEQHPERAAVDGALQEELTA